MEKALPLFPVVEYWARFQGIDYQINNISLIALGLVVGIMTGFFGIGGRFLMTPLLNIFFNVPYNVAVGSEICQMVGTSSMNIMKLRKMGNVDYKLAVILLGGAIIGVELGAHILEVLKMAGNITLMGQSIGLMFLILSTVYAGLFLWLGAIIYRESKVAFKGNLEIGDMTALQFNMTARLQTIRIRPMISLPVSGIETISLWVVVGVGFVTGLLVGFLGVGFSFIAMPALIYVLGCPMVVAMSTDLFQGLLAMGYGTFSHSLKGNIDLMLVTVLLITTTLGMQMGTALARRFTGPRMRQGFALVSFLIVLLSAFKIVNQLGLTPFPF